MKHQLPETPDRSLWTPKKQCKLKKNALWLFENFPVEDNDFWRPALAWDIPNCDCKPEPLLRSWAKQA